MPLCQTDDMEEPQRCLWRPQENRKGYRSMVGSLGPDQHRSRADYPQMSLVDGNYRGGKIIFLYPSEFLAEALILKDRLTREKQIEVYAHLYIVYRWRFPGKNE